MVDALGRHLLLELSGCPYTLLNDVDFIRKNILTAAEKAKVTVISDSFNRFNPQGISGMVIIAESHISIHTWPEYRYAAVDIFTCGDSAMPDRALGHIIEALRPEDHKIYVVKRGVLSENVPSAQCYFGERGARVAGSSI